MPFDNHKKEIESVVSQINKSWLNKNTKLLSKFFHADMIITDSNFNTLAKNKKECIASYESFIKQANILKYRDCERTINIIGNTAIVNNVFDITWEVNKKISNEKGRDVFVFEFTNNKWLVVWRTIFPVF